MLIERSDRHVILGLVYRSPALWDKLMARNIYLLLSYRRFPFSGVPLWIILLHPTLSKTSSSPSLIAFLSSFITSNPHERDLTSVMPSTLQPQPHLFSCPLRHARDRQETYILEYTYILVYIFSDLLETMFLWVLEKWEL